MSKLVLFLGLSLVAACAPAQSNSTETAPADEQASDLSGSGCENTELFVQAGIADDLRKTVDPSFVSEGYYVKVPGAVMAFDSYGGDMVYTVLGASAKAERVFATNPGGGFSAYVSGSSGGDKYQKKGMASAQALFAAMTQVTETTATDSGWTTHKKVSTKGLFECEWREQGGVAKDASCAIKNLLMTRVVAQSSGNGFYCVK